MYRNSHEFGSADYERFRHDGGGAYAERPVKDLVRDMVQQGQRLIREEVHLAKIEARSEAQRVAGAGKGVAIGGTLLMASLYLFLFGVCFALGALIPLWLSAFIVGAVTAAIGFFLVKGGVNRVKNLSTTRQQTVDTIKENLPWKAVSERAPATISRTHGNA